jgi:hypothetical protein
MKPNTAHPDRDSYHIKIDRALNELIHLEVDGLYSIAKISWWVMKYEELSIYSYNYRHTDSCLKDMSCGCAWKSYESKFTDLYSNLEDILDLHKYEKYFEAELETFKGLQTDTSKISWYRKNEKFGNEKFILFWIEWIDEEYNLVDPAINNWENLNIIFSGKEWKHSIKFLQIFNEIDCRLHIDENNI